MTDKPLTAKAFPEVNVLGSHVRMIPTQDAVDLMGSWIGTRGPCRQIVVTGFHGIWSAHKDPQFRSILNGAELWVPDGIAPVLVARLRGIATARRVPGAELMEAFLARANTSGYSSFFYGESEATLAVLRQRLQERYPGHRIAGAISPPFRALTAEEEQQHIEAINAAKPDVVWVGLGLPKQERWIHRHRAKLQAPVAVGVGAAFAFLAGTVKRAPSWISGMGCEWAYRLMQEPRKCWRRCLLEGPQFVSHVCLELMGLRKYDDVKEQLVCGAK